MSTLMFSISGVRGIIGDGLDPKTIVKFTSAYADFVKGSKIIIGKDGRVSGNMVSEIVTGTLLAKGKEVFDLGICPTPTVLYNVKKMNAAGGIAISASHNPNEWNGLKFLNDKGEFLTPGEFEVFASFVNNGGRGYNSWNALGSKIDFTEGLKLHLDDVLKMKHIDLDIIRKRKFKILLDCVNASGAYIIPDLLKKLNCEVIELNCEKSGIFPRLAEPLPENIVDTMRAVKENNVDLGIVVDPDSDRLVLITDKGKPFGEENTITQAAKYILSKERGNVVVNLSTTRAIDDAAAEFGCKVFRSPVGEANVVHKMKEVNAVIGGEGSGGVIYPALQYGRDALVGIAITLQHLAETGKTISEIKEELPLYHIAKSKIEIAGLNPEAIINSLIEKYHDAEKNNEDGLRLDFKDHWVHFRKSNTEPIIRCIVEARTEQRALELINKYKSELIGN
ncbi:MAG: phosphoglucosamine mutase [bacterium]